MRGVVGGPLLCIGDLLSDVGEEDSQSVSGVSPSSSSLNVQPSHSDPNLVPSNLTTLFQENYGQLDKALSSTDQSWTALTLKLCTALETGNKLVEFANSCVGLLSEKVEQLEKVTRQTDSAVASAKAIQGSLKQIPINPQGQ